MKLLIAVSAFWVASEIVIMIAKRSRVEAADRKDRRSIQMLWLCFGLGSLLAGMLAGVPATRMPPPMRRYAFWTGIALIVAGMAVRWIAIATLKRYFTVDVAIAKDHKVIQHGLYRIIRHPSYAGALLSFTGLGLAFVNWASLIAVVVFAIAGLAYRIHVEEAALIVALGEDYRAYAARTKRLIPGIF